MHLMTAIAYTGAALTEISGFKGTGGIACNQWTETFVYGSVISVNTKLLFTMNASKNKTETDRVQCNIHKNYSKHYKKR